MRAAVRSCCRRLPHTVGQACQASVRHMGLSLPAAGCSWCLPRKYI